MQKALLQTLASYRDVFYPKVDLAHHDEMRAAIALHAMNHVLKFVHHHLPHISTLTSTFS